MNKEEILEKLQFIVRTVIHRRAEFSKEENAENLRELMNSITDHGQLLKEVDKLSKIDYDWLTMKYEEWFEQELSNHPEIQEIRKKMLRQ